MIIIDTLWNNIEITSIFLLIKKINKKIKKNNKWKNNKNYYYNNKNKTMNKIPKK